MIGCFNSSINIARAFCFIISTLITSPYVLGQNNITKATSAPKKPTTKLNIHENSIGIKFVKIPEGIFAMGAFGKYEYLVCSKCIGRGKVPCDGNHAFQGCPSCGDTRWKNCQKCVASGKIYTRSGGNPNELNVHQVTLTKPFFLSQFEITQAQWIKIMGTTPWDGDERVVSGDNFPAVCVTWEEVQVFCKKLSEKEGKEYRLPTEAEWEYACRAGSKSKFSFGEDEGRLDEYAWFAKNTYDVGKAFAHQVGMKKPNPWGLFDMHGNVEELCQDWYSGVYKDTPVTDPLGPPTGTSKVVRGGSWYNGFRDCTSARRSIFDLNQRSRQVGFRLLEASHQSSIADDSKFEIANNQKSDHNNMAAGKSNVITTNKKQKIKTDATNIHHTRYGIINIKPGDDSSSLVCFNGQTIKKIDYVFLELDSVYLFENMDVIIGKAAYAGNAVDSSGLVVIMVSAGGSVNVSQEFAEVEARNESRRQIKQDGDKLIIKTQKGSNKNSDTFVWQNGVVTQNGSPIR